MLPFILTALVGTVLGIMLSMLMYTREWTNLYKKLAKAKQENNDLYMANQRLKLEISLRDRGATFEED